MGRTVLDGARSRWRREDGFVVAEYLVATMVLLVLFMLATNLSIVWYAKGVVRASLDDGARYGALEGNTPDDCQQRARSMLDDLLGSAQSGIVISCTEDADGTVMRATATGSVPFWVRVGGIDNVDISHSAVIIREPELK